jgi:surfactin synthase thioesterase subunit
MKSMDLLGGERLAPDRVRPPNLAPSTHRVRLFCIPHAGGGASAYRTWAQALARDVDVSVLQLPGRESRFRENPLADLDSVLADLFRVVAPETTRPFSFFGHSMGGLLAFELSHMIRRRTGREPVHLFVSACRAPNRAQLDAPCVTLPPAQFVAEIVKRYGGIPAPILNDADYMAAILPALYADFGILERYRAPDHSPLGCPISVFGGARDELTPLASLQDWRLTTRGSFRLEMVDGDHFYLQQQRAALTANILSALAGETRKAS